MAYKEDKQMREQMRFVWREKKNVTERSGSVVECLTQDRGAAGSNLTSVTVLCP